MNTPVNKRRETELPIASNHSPQRLIRRMLLSLILLFFAAAQEARSEEREFSRFQKDLFSLEYPTKWSYKRQQAPDGSELHMFRGPQEQNALAYCHASQQPLNASLTPRLVSMNEQQRRDFFLTSSNQQLLFSLYDNLLSAQEFRLIHANAGVLGQATPAFLADFVFRVPQGYVYRVRSHYTFWKSAQLSIWCQTVSRSEGNADAAFQNNLATFQRLIASVKISP